MADKVDVDAIRDAAKRLGAEDGPIAYLGNVQTHLENVQLPWYALSILGFRVVTKHNTSVAGHLTNIKGGTQHLQDAAAKLEQTAKNWEASDQPWVVK